MYCVKGRAECSGCGECLKANFRCPKCGKEPETVYFCDGEIIGCDECITYKWASELGGGEEAECYV